MQAVDRWLPPFSLAAASHYSGSALRPMDHHHHHHNHGDHHGDDHGDHQDDDHGDDHGDHHQTHLFLIYVYYIKCVHYLGGTICKAFIGRAEFYGGLDLHFPWGTRYVRNIFNLDSLTMKLHSVIVGYRGILIS